MTLLPAASWEAVRSHVRLTSERRADALAWRGRVSAPVSVVWIDGELACAPEALAAVETLEYPYLTALGSDDLVLRRRVISAIHDRLAVKVALEELSQTPTPALPLRQSPVRNLEGFRAQGEGARDVVRTAHHSPLTARGSGLGARGSGLSLSHTPLGQPVLCRPGGARAKDLHVSFSHDGAAHLCALALGKELRGVGVDVVHLPRLRGRSDGYLHRFAGHFMSDEEYALFRRASEGEAGEALLRRTAAHFSLMEAASKALGTGLKIGAGMGKKESLPKQAVGVSLLGPRAEFLLGPEACSRCEELRAVRLEGHWATDEEYGVSVVLLHGNQGEHL